MLAVTGTFLKGVFELRVLVAIGVLDRRDQFREGNPEVIEFKPILEIDGGGWIERCNRIFDRLAVTVGRAKVVAADSQFLAELVHQLDLLLGNAFRAAIEEGFGDVFPRTPGFVAGRDPCLDHRVVGGLSDALLFLLLAPFLDLVEHRLHEAGGGLAESLLCRKQHRLVLRWARGKQPEVCLRMFNGA
ncbi:hypothetical protein D3C72_1455620 [compost metagenome]